MSEDAKIDSKAKLTYYLSQIVQFIPKNEIINLVEEAYKPTIKDWIDTLPPDIREKAIGNTPPVRLNSPAKSLFLALDQAFEWCNTKEGGQYWNRIAYGHEVV